MIAASKSSLVITVVNEERYIENLIDSIAKQSLKPNEILIIDGGSQDKTIEKINTKIKQYSKSLNIKLFVKKGNRSTGRNEGIKKASHDIILITDSGCILHKDWVKNILTPFSDKSTDVVAGYYKGKYENIFQKSLIPYVLVMSDRVDEKNFLPATRSMAFKKSVWKVLGGFDEKLSHNEDFDFANKIKNKGYKITFAQNAIVYWLPRQNLYQTFKMFFRFAFGDAESKIIRNKVILIFARYLFFVYLITISSLIKSFLLYLIVIVSPLLYLFWSVAKNYKYVRKLKAIYILPSLQIMSDIAVLSGTTLGLFKYLLHINYMTTFKKYYKEVILISIYVLIMLSVITSGLPSQSHPFNYQMDEWHQLQAVRGVFKFGSPNIEGAANGTMFNFFISGVMLIPFYLAKIVDPFAIRSAVDSVLEQEKLFTILRLFTLFFGVLTLIVMSKIAKLLKLNSFLTLLLFIFTPVWLVISNFFKYDIALTFWLVLSVFYLLKYKFTLSLKYFYLGSFLAGIAFSVKVSAIPLLPILVFAYFLFTPKINRTYKNLLIALTIYLFAAVFFGLPDIIFGGRNMYEYIYSNIIGSSQLLKNATLHDSLLNLTLFHKLPAIFGHIFYIFSILSAIYLLILTVRQFINREFEGFKVNIFILSSFLIFGISLIPLGITIAANRLTVLLPFMVIINAIAFRDLINSIKFSHKIKLLIYSVLIAVFIIQILESYMWIELKNKPLPQQTSSTWIVKNISKNSNIGMENVPIYQFEPDFILKEFYNRQYHPSFETTYNYFIVNKDSKILPEYIILSNVLFEEKYYPKSMKSNLVKRLLIENYKEIAYFPLEIPNYQYFDNYFYYPYLGLFAYPDGISIYKKP